MEYQDLSKLLAAFNDRFEGLSLSPELLIFGDLRQMLAFHNDYLKAIGDDGGCDEAMSIQEFVKFGYGFKEITPEVLKLQLIQNRWLINHNVGEYPGVGYQNLSTCVVINVGGAYIGVDENNNVTCFSFEEQFPIHCSIQKHDDVQSLLNELSKVPSAFYANPYSADETTA
ncbi:hypothetical protein [Runella sp.]|uniref:hypothetical protein n=1 Tax=Runella sp. TaxID=1960881 RepID=UPI003D0DF840